ncbi:MAG: hypothetical protein ACC628_21050 [Pirellulaceae bacterium]
MFVRRRSRSSFFLRVDRSPANLVDLFAGQAVFLIGNGPTFAHVDHTLLQKPGIVTMTMNNGAHLFRSDLWISQDQPHKFMPSIWTDPKITKFTWYPLRRRHLRDLESGRHSQTKVAECPNVFYHRRASRLSPETWASEGVVQWGRKRNGKTRRSTLLAAFHILFKLGFRKIYLLGMDFHMSPSNPYFFPQTYKQKAIDHNNALFVAIREMLQELRPVFEAHAVEVYNCTTESDLEVFPKMDLAEAVSRHAVSLDDSTGGMYRRRL